MSERLQVVMDAHELQEIRLVARAQALTVAEWVRQALRKERMEQPVSSAERKLSCVREAASYAYPTADIEEVLQDIDRGRDGTGET